MVLCDAGKQVYLICENGGSLENKPGTMFGFQSRCVRGGGGALEGEGAEWGLCAGGGGG